MSRWRRSARLVVLAVVVASFAWGGVRLVDPFPKADGADPVAVEGPPAAVAQDAIAATRTGNYQYVLAAGNGSWRQEVIVVSVDAADRQYLVEENYGGAQRNWTTYADESGTWEHDPESGIWYLNPPRSVHSRLGSPGVVTEAGADVSLVERNASTVVVRVNDTATALEVWQGGHDHGDDPRASLTLVVDRRERVLRRAVLRVSWQDDDEGERRTEVLVRRYRGWGEVDVRRPTDVPYGFTSILNDLANTCSTCSEGTR